MSDPIMLHETVPLGALVNSWHPIALTSEVTTQPAQRVLLGRRIVVYRDDQGPVVMDDLCVHRGTELSLGTVTGSGQLKCAYHGWEFGRDGSCTKIPSRAPEDPIPAKARVASHRVVEAHDLVWVCLGVPDRDVPEWPAGTWGAEGYRAIMLPSVVWRTSAGRSVENFLDFSHFSFVHEGILGTQDDAVVEEHEIVATDYGFRYERHRTEPQGLHSGADEMVHWEYQLHSPFTAHLRKIADSGRDTTISLIASPVEEKVTAIFFAIVRNYSATEVEDMQFVDFHDHVMEQDKRIVESQHPEEIPLNLRQELHIKVPDAAGTAFRRLLSRLVRQQESASSAVG